MNTKLDVAFKFGAGRYIQLPDALKMAGEEISRFGRKAFIIGGPTAISIVQEVLTASLTQSHVSYEIKVYPVFLHPVLHFLLEPADGRSHFRPIRTCHHWYNPSG